MRPQASKMSQQGKELDRAIVSLSSPESIHIWEPWNSIFTCSWLNSVNFETCASVGVGTPCHLGWQCLLLTNSYYHHGVWNLTQWTFTECPKWVFSCKLAYILCCCFFRMHHDPVYLGASKSAPRSRPFKTKGSAISALLVPLDWTWVLFLIESCQLNHENTVCVFNLHLILHSC